jgi:uncharacterized membrane protein YfcA
VDINIVIFALVGFVAQMIDGSLGMGYGVSATSFLMSLGIPYITPSVASACVHMSELFTTAVSGASHFKLGNVDKKIFSKLLIPGMIGGVLGAYVLTSIPGDVLKPFISAYLLIMGLFILYRGIKAIHKEREFSKRHLIPLGAVGGFFDAIGGGGWGPIVTTTLVAGGKHPRFAVGSVNSAEFFVTMAESITFVLTIGALLAQNWAIILGLIIGGVSAAPFAALISKKLPTRTFMVLVGLLIVFLSARTICMNLF